MENLNEKLTAIYNLMDEFKVNSAKQTEKGNKAAGTRARKNSLQLTALLKEFRKLSIEASK